MKASYILSCGATRLDAASRPLMRTWAAQAAPLCAGFDNGAPLRLAY